MQSNNNMKPRVNKLGLARAVCGQKRCVRIFILVPKLESTDRSYLINQLLDLAPSVHQLNCYLRLYEVFHAPCFYNDW